MERTERFLWGSATAAYQCEGAWDAAGKGLSNWDVFCHSDQNNLNPVTGDVASDHFYRFEEDIRMLADGNQNAYRFSLAWTRIIPAGTGEISSEGIDHYNRVIDACLRHGVEPVVTLYHYDLPQALFEAGGWENRATVAAFADYAEVCFQAFGDRVRYWLTINEPGYETFCSYAAGNYPPNVQDLARRWKAMHHLLLASATAVQRYRRSGDVGSIGLVSDSYPIQTLHDDPAYTEAARLADLFFNRCVNDVCIDGTIPAEFLDQLTRDGVDLSFIHDADRATLRAGTVDYLGLNVYDRVLVKPYTGGPTVLANNNTGDGARPKAVVKDWFELDNDESTVKNPWGMEIYPQAMFDLLIYLKDRYPAIPIMVTENGVGYYDELVDGQVHDDYRIDYLHGFIAAMKQAIDAGCDVRGYLVWSSMDLYSWINGYKKRYGLVYVDYDNDQARIPKDSYHWYREFLSKEIEKQ